MELIYPKNIYVRYVDKLEFGRYVCQHKTESDMHVDVARQFFADFFYGEHHLPGKIKKDSGGGWSVAMPGELASTDFNDLTRLVLMAHERAIRVSVRPLNFKLLKISIHPRDPNSDELSVGHPSLSEAINRNAAWNAKHKYTVRPGQLDYVKLPQNCPVKTKTESGETVEYSSQAACAEALGVSRQVVNKALIRGTRIGGKYYVSAF